MKKQKFAPVGWWPVTCDIKQVQELIQTEKYNPSILKSMACKLGIDHTLSDNKFLAICIDRKLNIYRPDQVYSPEILHYFIKQFGLIDIYTKINNKNDGIQDDSYDGDAKADRHKDQSSILKICYNGGSEFDLLQSLNVSDYYLWLVQDIHRRRHLWTKAVQRKLILNQQNPSQSQLSLFKFAINHKLCRLTQLALGVDIKSLQSDNMIPLPNLPLKVDFGFHFNTHRKRGSITFNSHPNKDVMLLNLLNTSYKSIESKHHITDEITAIMESYWTDCNFIRALCENMTSKENFKIGYYCMILFPITFTRLEFLTDLGRWCLVLHPKLNQPIDQVKKPNLIHAELPGLTFDGSKSNSDAYNTLKRGGHPKTPISLVGLYDDDTKEDYHVCCLDGPYNIVCLNTLRTSILQFSKMSSMALDKLIITFAIVTGITLLEMFDLSLESYQHLIQGIIHGAHDLGIAFTTLETTILFYHAQIILKFPILNNLSIQPLLLIFPSLALYEPQLLFGCHSILPSARIFHSPYLPCDLTITYNILHHQYLPRQLLDDLLTVIGIHVPLYLGPANNALKYLLATNLEEVLILFNLVHYINLLHEASNNTIVSSKNKQLGMLQAIPNLLKHVTQQYIHVSNDQSVANPEDLFRCLQSQIYIEKGPTVMNIYPKPTVALEQSLNRITQYHSLIKLFSMAAQCYAKKNVCNTVSVVSCLSTISIITYQSIQKICQMTCQLMGQKNEQEMISDEKQDAVSLADLIVLLKTRPSLWKPQTIDLFKKLLQVFEYQQYQPLDETFFKDIDLILHVTGCYCAAKCWRILRSCHTIHDSRNEFHDILNNTLKELTLEFELLEEVSLVNFEKQNSDELMVDTFNHSTSIHQTEIVHNRFFFLCYDNMPIDLRVTTLQEFQQYFEFHHQATHLRLPDYTKLELALSDLRFHEIGDSGIILSKSESSQEVIHHIKIINTNWYLQPSSLKKNPSTLAILHHQPLFLISYYEEFQEFIEWIDLAPRNQTVLQYILQYTNLPSEVINRLLLIFQQDCIQALEDWLYIFVLRQDITQSESRIIFHRLIFELELTNARPEPWRWNREQVKIDNNESVSLDIYNLNMKRVYFISLLLWLHTVQWIKFRQLNSTYVDRVLNFIEQYF